MLVCGSSLGFGQISFYKQFSNNGYDYGQGITQTEDSSYLVTGWSSSFVEGASEAFLLKVDSLGEFKWSRHYGGSESDGGRRVMYIQNHGIYIAGYTNSFGNGAYDFYLVKTDTDGNQLWDMTYGTSGWERVLDAALTRDSGVIMIGETTNTSDGLTDIYMVRTDKDGNEVWSQQLGGVGEDQVMAIEPFDDYTYIVGGKTYVEDSALCKALLFKLHEDGTILWSDTVGANGYYQFNALSIVESNGDIAAVGMNIFPSGDTAIFESKSNSAGTFYFLNQALLAGIDYYTGLASFGTGDRFVAMQNYDNEYAYGGLDLTVSQNYSYLGWENTIGGVNYAGDEIGGELIPTSDHGAIIVGYNTPTEIGGSNVFLLKLYPNSAFIGSNDSFTAEPLVGISNLSKDELLTVYPNPASGMVHFALEPGKTYTVNVVDQMGRANLSTTFMQMCELDLSSLRSGTYLIHVQDEEGQHYRARVVVQH